MTSAVFDFPPFRADARRRSLSRAGRELTLPRKAFDTLVALLEKAGEIVTKDELLRRVWSDSFVEENSLNQSISALRKALGDQAKLIETIPGRGYRFLGKQERPSQPHALAILPLRAFAADDEALGIGIADTLTTRLGNVRALVVRPTSAVLRFARGDRDPVEAGRALGVDAVLDGGIRRSGDRLRVNVQLVSVESGAAMWAGTFDEQFTEIFAVEDSISQRVAEALTTHLTGEERSQLTRRPTENSEAYRLYLNGRWYANRLTREGSAKAIESLEKAIALDPSFDLGHAGLAHLFLQSMDMTMPSLEAMTRAEEAARRAPGLVDSQVAIAAVRWYRDWDREGAIVEFERALELDPRSAYAHNHFGFCLVLMGDFERGFEELRVAAELDPHSPENAFYEIPSHYFAGRFDEAIRRARVAIDDDPEFWLMHVILGRALEMTGDVGGAIAEYERGRDLAGSILEPLGDLGRATRSKKILAELRRQRASAYTIAYACLGVGDVDAAFDSLSQAVADHSWYVSWLDVDPILGPLRGDQRFAALRAASLGARLRPSTA